jgi:hypothetical protein
MTRIVPTSAARVFPGRCWPRDASAPAYTAETGAPNGPRRVVLYGNHRSLDRDRRLVRFALSLIEAPPPQHPDQPSESESSPSGLCGFCSYASIGDAQRRRHDRRIPRRENRDHLGCLRAPRGVCQGAPGGAVWWRDGSARSAQPSHPRLPGARPARHAEVRGVLSRIARDSHRMKRL